jgi:hypothetical protein
MGENIKVVWAEFSTLSWTVLLDVSAFFNVAISTVEHSAQFLS